MSSSLDWKRLLGWGIFSSVILALVAIGPAFLLVNWLGEDEVTSYGSAGDMFGAGAALFSGLGFLGFVLVLFRDLRHREEDRIERRRSRTPFLVPDIIDSGARVTRAKVLTPHQWDVAIALDLVIENITSEPAVNATLHGIDSTGLGLEANGTLLKDTPFGTGESSKKTANLYLSSSGPGAKQVLVQLAGSTPIVIDLTVEYASVTGTRWRSLVSYELSTVAADRGVFRLIVDGESTASFEEGSEISGGSAVYLRARTVPSSWKHEHLD